MDLKEKRAGLIKQAQQILAKADVTSEDLETVDGLKAEIEQLSARLKAANEFADLAASFDQTEDAPAANIKAGSLGEHFFKSVGEQFKASRGIQGVTVSAPEYFKEEARGDDNSLLKVVARPTDRELVTSDVIPGFVQAPRDRLMIADILGKYAISGNTVTYWEEPTVEDDFKMIAEGKQKAELQPGAPKKVVESLAKIAGYWTVTDEMLEDEAYLVSAINNLLTYKLELAFENQLLNGDGVGANIKGLLNREKVQNLNQNHEPITDTIFKAMTNVQTGSGMSADAVVINPADWQELRLSKDQSGQYYAGGAFTGAYGNGGLQIAPNPWGLTPVITPRIKKGTALVGNFRMGAQVALKGGLRLDASNSHANNFTSNLTTFRLERRALLMVPTPTAFVKVTLGG